MVHKDLQSRDYPGYYIDIPMIIRIRYNAEAKTGSSEMLKTSLRGLSTPTTLEKHLPAGGQTLQLQEKPSEEPSSNCTDPEGQGASM